MFGILAVIAAALGYLLNGLAVHTNAWFSPLGLGLLSIAFLALHLIGANSWIPRR
jgi:hypothetical protein